MRTLLPFLLIAALLTAGCESRYRYECQDPDNWSKPDCQKPACESSGTCPDMLLGKPVAEETVQAVESGEACNCEEQTQGE